MAVHGSALAKNGGMRPWATVAYSRWLLEQAAAEESDAELNFVEAELLRLFLHLFFLRRPTAHGDEEDVEDAERERFGGVARDEGAEVGASGYIVLLGGTPEAGF